MKSQVQRELLTKVISFIEKIKGQLQEVGLSKSEMANYFATHIFKNQDQARRQSEGQIVVKKQFQIWLGAKRSVQVPIKTVLVELLACLEIEYEYINLYENYQPEKTVVVMKTPKKCPKALNLEVPVLKKREVNCFWEKLRQYQSVVKESPIRNSIPPSTLLQDFQKQFNESLMKTKQLKRLIQQKISEQLYDPFASRTRHIHNMLALQSN